MSVDLNKTTKAIEATAKATRVAFDKTGTLTAGRPSVTDVVPLNGAAKAEVLAVAAGVEAGSSHPLAEAIVRGAEDRGVEMVEAGDFEAVTGQGVRGIVDGQPVAGDVLDVVVIDTGREGHLSFFVAEAPIDDAARQQLVDDARVSLRVEG